MTSMAHDGSPLRGASQSRNRLNADGRPVDLHAPELFVDRELSMLGFFRRVLEEAADPRNPLLERVKFIAIVSSDLAEFFMVRVAGLKQQIAAGVSEISPAGLTPSEQLVLVRKESQRLMEHTRACLRDILRQLDENGIRVVDYDRLDPAMRERADAYFQTVVFPVLTPLAVDPGRPFPHISNMSLNLAVVIRDQGETERFARVKLPATLPRLVGLDLPGNDGEETPRAPAVQTFTWLDQLIAANLPALFPGMTVVSAHGFRITRDAEVQIQELEAADLLETIEKGVRRRRFGSVVRVTVDESAPQSVRSTLIENLEIERGDLYTLEPPLGMSDVMQLAGIDRADLKAAQFIPRVPWPLDDMRGDVFSVIRMQDIFIHHPYDSFEPLVRFLIEAARDPSVLAIKQTLYRVGSKSPVVEALLEAARNGKQVAVLVELKARFDEESNIEWARALEREGVHVVYGLLGLKTHSKLALVVRQEGDGIRRYVHLSTGNYNATTSRQYTDMSIFTADSAIGADASDLFNYLTGYSQKRDYRKLLVAPFGLRTGIERLIRREIACKERGEEAHLVFKVNALVDRAMIELLYEASQAGVEIDLIVRGMCCLKPGRAGVSESIRVRSIVGRFLEHSRVFYFHNGGKDEVYLGSADLMMRNLDRRVEILFPLEDPRLVRFIRDEILDAYLCDNTKARIMDANGEYRRAESGDREVDAQQLLFERTLYPPESAL